MEKRNYYEMRTSTRRTRIYKWKGRLHSIICWG